MKIFSKITLKIKSENKSHKKYDFICKNNKKLFKKLDNNPHNDEKLLKKYESEIKKTINENYTKSSKHKVSDKIILKIKADVKVKEFNFKYQNQILEAIRYKSSIFLEDKSDLKEFKKAIKDKKYEISKILEDKPEKGIYYLDNGLNLIFNPESDKFITIIGFDHHHKLKPFEINSIVKLVKEPDNRRDSESIAVEKRHFGKVGRIANSTQSVVNGTMSAGRIYDKFSDFTFAEVKFIANTQIIARVLDRYEIETLSLDDESDVYYLNTGDEKYENQ